MQQTRAAGGAAATAAAAAAVEQEVLGPAQQLSLCKHLLFPAYTSLSGRISCVSHNSHQARIGRQGTEAAWTLATAASQPYVEQEAATGGAHCRCCGEQRS